MNGFHRFSYFIGVVVLSAAIAAPAAVGATVNKKQANRVVREGAYSIRNGRLVRADKKTKRKAPPARRPSSVKAKSKSKSKVKAKLVRSKPKARVVKKGKKYTPVRTAKKSSRAKRKIASQTPKKSKRTDSKKTSRKKVVKSASFRSVGHKKQSIPVARETPSERDMPFVSVPSRRISRKDKTILMEDPAVHSPLQPPKAAVAPLQPDLETLEPELERVPAAVAEASAAEQGKPEVREPDAFDLHSGNDPMRGP
jgi:hypothetical protein